jgi:hypothetical protein
MVAPEDRFKERQWVVQTRGANSGRIGCIHAVFAGKTVMTPRYWVQFGSCGPFSRLLHTSLRKATPEEIAHISGCRVQDLPEHERAA